MIVPNRDCPSQAEEAKQAGMALAAAQKRLRIDAGKVAMLEALLQRSNGTGTIDDATPNLAYVFEDGGNWRGSITLQLAKAKIITRVSDDQSLRPSRHSARVTVWRLVDRRKAKLQLGRLKAAVESQTKALDRLATAQNEAPAAATAGASDSTSPRSQQQGGVS